MLSENLTEEHRARAARAGRELHERAETVQSAKARFQSEPEVQQCYYVTGGTSFILIVVTTDMAGLVQKTSNFDFDLVFNYLYQFGDPAVDKAAQGREVGRERLVERIGGQGEVVGQGQAFRPGGRQGMQHGPQG